MRPPSRSTVMKHLTTFAGSLLPIVLAITGCKKSAAPDETATRPVEATKPTAPAGPAAVVGVWKDVPNINGFAADVPAGAEPNGLGGAAGFHTADDSFDLTWMETS